MDEKRTSTKKKLFIILKKGIIQNIKLCRKRIQMKRARVYTKKKRKHHGMGRGV